MAESEHVFTLSSANPHLLLECASMLLDSEFGARYFSIIERAEASLRPGFEKGEVVCVTNKRGETIGFAWSSMNGAFGRFPFLHAIAVKPAYRSIGAGSFLLEYIEETAFSNAETIFTLTNSSCLRVLRFFQRRKYRHIGKVPHLILPGVDETILMKVKD